jgi:hypothetical protein
MTEIVHLEGLPQVRKMLDQFEGQQLQNKMRVAVRAGLKSFQKTLAFEGDTPGHPHSFTKVPAGKVTTHGGASGREIEGSVRPKSPLFNIFEPGARGHTIAPKKGILAGPAGSGGWDAKGRKRKAAFFARGPVSHPGMSARPILPAAFSAGESAASDAVANAIFKMTSEPTA